MELIQSTRSKTEIVAIRRSLRELGFDVIPVNEAMSYLAAALMEKHARSDGLHLADALIAATAQERGDTLATANVRHFRALDKLDLRAFRSSRQP